MRILIGILLMIVGFVALFGVMVVPVLPSTEANVTINNYLQSLLCKPGEKFTRELYQTSDSDGTGYSMTPYCVNSERQREDVSGKWALIGIGGFLGPFLVGLFWTIISASMTARRRTGQLFQTIPNSSGGTDFAIINASGSPQNVGLSDGTLKVNGFEIKMDSLTPEKIEALKAQMQAHSDAGSLTAKLRQLQEAKENGLISSAEYERLRQKVLDEVT